MLSTFSSISGSAFSSWMRDFIPINILGDFYSKKMTLSLIVGMIVSFTAGLFIDIWEIQQPQQELIGFSILFFVAFGFGMLSIYFIAITPEPTMMIPEKRVKFSKILTLPLIYINYINLLIFLAVLSFSLNLATPFFTFYMVKRLNL